MDKVQFIHDDKGERLFAVVPAAEYEALTADAEMRADIAAFDRAEAAIAAGEELIPGAIVERLLSSEESRLKIWRQHRSLTQEELARRAGVNRTYISAIEQGRQDGSVRVWRKLAQALERDVDDLLPRD